MLPMAGEYTGGVVRDGVQRLRARATGRDVLAGAAAPAPSNEATVRLAAAMKATEGQVHPRPPSFCTGCPERPIFTAHEAGRARARPASRQLRHRLPPVLDPAAVQHRRHHDGLRPRRRGRGGVQRQGGQARDRGHGRRRLLAQRPDLGDRQRGVQQDRQRPHHRRQRLHGGDRRPGHPLVQRRQHDPHDQQSDREGGARRRRRVGAHDHAHLRRRQDARHAARGADHRRRKARRSSSRSPNAC